MFTIESDCERYVYNT